MTDLPRFCLICDEPVAEGEFKVARAVFGSEDAELLGTSVCVIHDACMEVTTDEEVKEMMLREFQTAIENIQAMDRSPPTNQHLN